MGGGQLIPVEYRVCPENRGDVHSLVMEHYLHRWPGVVTGILALKDCDLSISVIVFALPPRETAKRYGVPLVWELARLFVIDGTPKNTESWFMARAVAWVKRNRPDVGALVSYADPSAGHAGTIYKAANWIADGRTDQERKTPRFDYQGVNGEHYSRRGHIPEGAAFTRVARVSKWRFVYWLDRAHEKRRALAA